MILTEREKELMTLVANGMRRQEIGDTMGLKKATVDKYLEKIRHKNGFKTFHKAIYEFGYFVAKNT